MACNTPFDVVLIVLGVRNFTESENGRKEYTKSNTVYNGGVCLSVFVGFSEYGFKPIQRLTALNDKIVIIKSLVLHFTVPFASTDKWKIQTWTRNETPFYSIFTRPSLQHNIN
ncbi:hypothetical protein MTR_8g077915 [Medicago truncatula]|uniref:Uncharacterized protein n=1 Tax=Medicago truncatula TaxID=3880 RepID=A0A072TSH4_MEDTR|nr:hypothetical protein MTR_8g077915 [Medicago truncatula]